MKIPSLVLLRLRLVDHERREMKTAGKGCLLYYIPRGHCLRPLSRPHADFARKMGRNNTAARQ